MNTQSSTEVARLSRLASAGVELDSLSDEQLTVLAELGDDEIDMLLDVRTRLVETTGPEVEAHAATARPMTIGGLFF